MRNWLFLLVVVIGPLQAATQASIFEQCLIECYGVDDLTAGEIAEKVNPLLQDDQYDGVIESFMERSNSLMSGTTSNFTESEILPTTLPYHSVLFENANVRISWAVTKSGEQEPFLAHPWKTLMLIVRSSQFYSEMDNGVTYEDDWPIGVYLLDPSPDRCSCKNIGSQEYNGLIIEIKSLGLETK